MRINPIPLFIAATTCLAAPVFAEDVRSILQKVQEKKYERWQGVDNCTADQPTMGVRALLYYERVEVADQDGRVQPSFRMVPIDEIE